MLEAEPCLWNDFQFMLLLDGSIVHLDFVWCAVEEGKVASKSCPSTLDSLVDRVRKAMDEAEQELEADTHHQLESICAHSSSMGNGTT